MAVHRMKLDWLGISLFRYRQIQIFLVASFQEWPLVGPRKQIAILKMIPLFLEPSAVPEKDAAISFLLQNYQNKLNYHAARHLDEGMKTFFRG